MSRVRVEGLRVAFDGIDVLHGIDLEVEQGSVVALLGPSGCGKTTLLRAIAGLERPVAGTIRLGDAVVDDAASTHVAAERRRVGMVFQDWALFPHLSVRANVSYGLPRKERRGPRPDDALDLVDLRGFEDRPPSTLSGGQQQRVALARALAPRPEVLLLDEPFSSLDTTLRAQVRSDLHELLGRIGTTTIFVTHDQDEAFVLGDRVAVMSNGQIMQMATPDELYTDPVDPWVASFVGAANLVPGEASGTEAETVFGRVPLRSTAQGPVLVLFRPEHLSFADDGAGREADVVAVEYFGRETAYGIATEGLRYRLRVAGPPRVERGDRVRLRPGPGPYTRSLRPEASFPAPEASMATVSSYPDPSRATVARRPPEVP